MPLTRSSLLPTAVTFALVALFTPHAGHAQSVVNLSITRDAILAGDSVACLVRSARKAVPDQLKLTTPDSVIVEVFEDDARTKKIAPKAGLQVRLGPARVGNVPPDSAHFAMPVGVVGLADRVVSLQRIDGTAPLCRVVPFPYAATASDLARKTHTDVIASGEVSNALRGGTSGNAVATGTLGFSHTSLPHGAGPRRYFPLGGEAGGTPTGFQRLWSWYRMDGENLRVVFNVASTLDSLTGGNKGRFAQGLLLPSVGKGGNRAVDMEYYPYFSFGPDQSQHFGIAFRFTASDAIWAPDSAGLPRALGHRAVLTAFDARARAILIDRAGGEDGNSMSFGLDAGYIRRSIGGDITDEPTREVLAASLGEPDRTSFPGWVAGTTFRLRQVTAYADFLCLTCKVFGSAHFFGTPTEVPSLGGLQPVIGFRFDAPLFALTPK